MHVNPYGEEPVRFATELVNEPPTSAADLEQRCDAWSFRLELPATDSDVSTLARFTRVWATIADTEDAEERSRILNGLLTSHTWPLSITDHARTGWHLHFRPDGLDAAGAVAAIIAAGTALHFVNRGIDRLHRCAAQDCDQIFGDFSRGGRQRYCSHPCSNRDAVRRHRARAASLS